MKHSYLLLACPLLLAACAGGETEPSELGAPMVIGLSHTEVGVGERINIIGGNFANGPRQRTDILLEGEYQTEAGAVHPVSMTVETYWEDGNTLVWQHVGPYTIPFSPTGDELGVFRGTVTAINHDDDTESEEWSAPAPVELRMKPSIIIRSLQPVDANCAAPVLRAVGGLPYRAEVEAVGFEPVNFTYVIAGEPGQPVPRIYRHEADGRNHAFGDDGELTFELVPNDGSPFYPTIFAVSALGADGVERHTGAIIGVHNPIEVIPLPTFEIAEIEPAIPVSGCIVGGDTNGRTVTYSESESDIRSRTQELNWDESWYEQVSSTSGGETTQTNGISVSDATANQTGTVFTWHWKAGATVSTEVSASVPFLASGKVGVEASVEGGQQYANYNLTTRTRTVGSTYSSSDTESWAYEQSKAYTVSQGGSDSYTVSSENSTIVSFEGLILPGQFGVFYRQATRINLPGLVIAYSACGIPEVVGDATFTDYTWSVDLATGNTCPDFPESGLPEAQCFKPPCGNVTQ